MAGTNYKLIVSYDGTRYYGWEHQPGRATIQGKLEEVLSRMLTEGEDSLNPGSMRGNSPSRNLRAGASANAAARRITDASAERRPTVTVIGAGRTDAGVHARAMTCNVVLDTEKGAEQIQQYLNRYLPEDISVNEVRVAADRFHARYNALGKTYRYTLWYAEDGSRPVFDRRYVCLLEKRPDVERMRAAADYLCGEHDFSSFCGNPHFRKSAVRRLDTIRIEESGHYIRIYYHGSGFLQNMVRILTGTLLETGWGKREPKEMKETLAARNRQAAGFTAPAQGLCLMKVDY